ncbi:rubredoxin-like domain-containing protein [Peptostreptococcus faecalis]|uniref:rubredoxin-like domain-containing protein n=1 Tax=Peptostreptococcus faecalis TaxID=2045015 RepID=UPI000C79D0F4|nr:rubrerythrin [Peptostreptococcus faecalis]
MKKFKCKECGYVHIGEDAPAVCPVCGYDSSVFFEMENEDSDSEKEYFEMILDADDNDIKLLRNQFDLSSKLAGISLAMSKQALHEGKEDEGEYFQKVALELLDQSSIYSMLLGEYLEFNTESNSKELAKKLTKLDEYLKSLNDSLNIDDREELSVLTSKSKVLNKFIDELK